jgi:demethylmenaquinone methyltransferase/2-methoxy-6-polyprenyl-1,4-benzoquinol methylase
MEKTMNRERSLGRYFDGCASAGIMDAFSPEEEARLRRIEKRWAIRRGQRVLEPGCGSGRLTERLARAVGPTGAVLAFDLSDLMLRKAAGRRLPPQALVIRASAHQLPAPSGSFDSVICFHAFPHFEDPPRALADIARVLKKGGSLWIEHLKGRAAINRIHRGAGPEVRSHLIPPAPALRKLLRSAGFRVKHLRDSSAGYSLLALK